MRQATSEGEACWKFLNSIDQERLIKEMAFEHSVREWALWLSEGQHTAGRRLEQ